MRAARKGRRNASQVRVGRVYEGAFESVFAILIAGGLGYWVDEQFGTRPGFLLLGLAIGFGAFVLRLWKLGSSLQKMAGGTTAGPTSTAEIDKPDDQSDDRPEAGSSDGH